MERPWLILGRVLLVNPGADAAAQGQAQQHAAVAVAEEDEQHAGAGEAEVNVAAAAVEAQDAVEEAEAEDEEEEDPQQAELEESVVDTNTNMAESEAAHAARGAAGPNLTIAVARPPWVTSLNARPSSHPNPGRPDSYPYIIATGPFCLLVHFAVAPSHGTSFGQEPNHSHLVVVRHFRRAGPGGGHVAACAVRVPDRPDGEFPALRNIESVGLICDQNTGHYLIAELIVTPAEAAVAYTRTDTGVWHGNHFVNPLREENNRRDWVPHGTVTINSTVLWFDLSWGIISCDLAQPPLLQVMNFHRLPPGRLLRAGAGAMMPDIHSKRCIAVSENLVWYLEIILNNPPQAATVNMWYRDVEDNPWRWNANYSLSFEAIWADESYDHTGLPWNTPMLAGVSPVNSNVVYFTLDDRLFGVNVPQHRVVHCEYYDPLSRPGPDDEPVTSRYLITWNLDADQEPNVGHQPAEPSDHGDSSDSGPMDEGDVDYQSPSE